jgi:hypothetical protein
LASGYRLGVGAESFSSTEIVLARRKTFREIFWGCFLVPDADQSEGREKALVGRIER